MTSDPNLKNTTAIPKPTTADIRARIAEVAATATAEEIKAVEDIISRSINAKKGCSFYTLTPPMSALIFLHHNPYNRDWRIDGPRGCLELIRCMEAKQWQYNGEGISFYVTGALANGQHRTSSAALAGITLEVSVSFGVQSGAVDTIDNNGIRHAFDAAKLEGVEGAKIKQTVIKDAGRYFSKAGIDFDVLKSTPEINDAMQRHNPLLTEAIYLGDGSTQNVVNPLLKGVQAATVAFIMLRSGWPANNIREKLALLQLRVSHDGENSPYFVAAKIIADARDRARVSDRLSGIKEVAVIIRAFQDAEAGVRAVQPKMIRDAARKARFPDPAWHPAPSQLAAE